jgi:hypothetical protein
MHRTKVPSFFGPLFLSMFLAASIASTPVLHAQAPAAGATIAVKMIDTVDSSKDPAGKQYRASVTKTVDAGNGVTIPQGTVAAVTLVNSGNGSGWTTQLVSVTVNGQPVAVSSGSASVTTAAQSAAGSAVNSINSVLGGFRHHVNAPVGATAIATGQRVVLPPGTPLTFVLSQPPAASLVSPGAPAVAAASAPSAPQPMQTSEVPVAAAEQHWWMCRYQDPKDAYKPALGSRMYYALFPSSADPIPMKNHFNAYVQQHYKLRNDTGNAGIGFCKRVSDDTAGRTYSMDMFLKQWASSNIEPVKIPWSDMPAEDAAIDAKLAGAASVTATAAATPTAAANQNYVWCHSAWAGTVGTMLPAGTILYFSDVFPGTIPPQNGAQTFQTPFFAFLQKKYGYKDAGNYPVDCSVGNAPTLAGLQNAQKYKQQYEDMTRQLRGQVIETGWSGQGAPGQSAAASPVAQPPSSSGSNSKECEFHVTCTTSPATAPTGPVHH